MAKKKSRDEPDAVKSLFAADNPFRRRKRDPASASASASTAAPCSPPPEPSDDKKRKREKPSSIGSCPISTPTSAPKKRKKVEDEVEVEGEKDSHEKKRRKRKRDELELEYEKRRYGPADEEEVEEEEKGEKKEPKVAVGGKRKAEDVVKEEMTVSKEEAFDDESKLLRTVFVGNLPLKTKRKALMKEFLWFGEVESVRIRSVPLIDSKIPRKGAIIKGKVNDAVDSVHAYVVFKDEQSARAALSHNMAEMGGNHIRVDMACPPRKKMKGEALLYDRKRTVFVGNLPFDVKDEELYQLFSTSSPSESSVEAIRVIRDPNTSLGKGIAYVLFKTRDAANAVIRKRDLKIRDRPLRLCHAKSDTNLLSKRKDPGPKRDFPRKRSAVMSSDALSTGKAKPKVMASSLTYQGLRASKSGILKKAGLHPHANSELKRGGPEHKARKAKRPAVAARKAKLLKKRKQESGTPENTHRNKKARR